MMKEVNMSSEHVTVTKEVPQAWDDSSKERRE